MTEAELKALDETVCHALIYIGYPTGDDKIEVALKVTDGPLAGIYFNQDVEVQKET